VMLDTDGEFDCYYKTATATATLQSSGTRYDDNRWHYVVMRRLGASSFDLAVDGVQVATSSASPSNDATALATFNIGGVDPANTTEAALASAIGAGGLIRRVVTIAGYAMTDVEARTLWNDGIQGGAVPTSGTLKLNLFPGSGGMYGPDVDISPNAYGLTVVDAQRVDAADSSEPIGFAPRPFTRPSPQFFTQARRYNGTLTNAGGNSDLLSIQPAANKPCRLAGWILGQTTEVADAAEESLRISVHHMATTFTVGSGGSAISAPAPERPGYDPAAGFTARCNDTTVATTSGTDTVKEETAWNIRSTPWERFIPEEMRLKAINGEAIVVKMDSTPADDIAANLTFFVEEL
jgi:hypothetical protein